VSGPGDGQRLAPVYGVNGGFVGPDHVSSDVHRHAEGIQIVASGAGDGVCSKRKVGTLGSAARTTLGIGRVWPAPGSILQPAPKGSAKNPHPSRRAATTTSRIRLEAPCMSLDSGTGRLAPQPERPACRTGRSRQPRLPVWNSAPLAPRLSPPGSNLFHAAAYFIMARVNARRLRVCSACRSFATSSCETLTPRSLESLSAKYSLSLETQALEHRYGTQPRAPRPERAFPQWLYS